MATNPETQVEDPQAEVTEAAEAVEEQFAAADEAAEPAPPTVEEIAARVGWVPQDKFKGPADVWKPAHQFILDGNDIKDRLSRELKGLRETTETIQKTTSSIIQDKLRQQAEELSAKYAAAVERGDPDEAFKLGKEILSVQDQASPKPQGPAPETQAWVGKNQRLMSDPVARQRALQVCDAYASEGLSTAEQLANTEAVMRREYPHLFEDKAPASVAAPQSRSSAALQRGEKTSADLPKEAKAVAQDLVDRGLIPNLDSYAKNYFAAQAKGK